MMFGGYKVHVDTLNPTYVETAISDGIPPKICHEGPGYIGPFIGAQVDLTSVAKEEYITFSVQYIAKGK